MSNGTKLELVVDNSKQQARFSRRVYLFAEDGVKRIALRVLDRLYEGDHALPAYAGTRQKVATVTVATSRAIARIEVIGLYWQFDEIGKLDMPTRMEPETLSNFLPTIRDRTGVVVDGPPPDRKAWAKRHRWQPSKADLDLIGADLGIGGFSNEGPPLRYVQGAAAKPDTVGGARPFVIRLALFPSAD
jgi:hypothetical protein